MTLLELLTAICFFMPFCAAVETVRHATVSVGRTILTFVAAFGMGVISAGLMWGILAKVGTGLTPYPQSKQKKLEKVMLVVAILWILGVAFLADQLMRFISTVSV